ncbi:alpha/beta hydrolase [Allokutzneria sp. A3M-2-11 16]|uniref:alpha/beta hydrolase n=1 Tax=Allokutzneria sp. A3M-2-11 16 TaxID=2962043 RepID=UPI0020B847ED|nr:alpha/beta hydrolase [Allokutzneria sp. A3M-2-11 16]MCP3802379.1 alpha/beta hydrolase [Allokutzneria sp. A3M-2-11 16]
MRLRWRVSIVAACLASLLSPVPAAARGEPVCQEFDQTVPVLLGQSRVRGTLCVPGSTKTVVVMVAGSTYNGTYWDFPYQPEKYNFRRAMNAAGHATVVVDRLGTGGSSVPLGAQLTTFVQAGAVHEVIQSLRAGRIGGRAFGRVILAGHSLGSTVVILESATYRDVDGVVVTGLTHHLNLVTAVKVVASMYPAALDPQLRGRNHDPTYLTTQPGKRKELFHDPGQVDPGVVAVDERTKDVFAATEAADAVGVAVVLPYSARITAPVLLVLGGSDPLLCGLAATNCTSAQTVLASERPYYAGSPCVSAYLQPGAGHDVNLHPLAPQYQQRVRTWVDQVVAGPLRC